uniref:Pancreatic trypsin inhibitor n=1 Tax=Rhipicephalus zambeziensis TaxID=60191 RepID=A0A224YCQ2_9ACAR
MPTKNFAARYCVHICLLMILLARSMTAYVHGIDIGNCNSPPPNELPCKDGSPKLMWFFNSSTECCYSYNYSGCGNGVNKFPDPESCMAICNPPTYTLEDSLPSLE